MPLTDDALVTETLAGSQAAFEQLVERYERLVFKVAWSYGRRRESALDIAQEVFVKAYGGLRSYRGEGAFKPWLMRITHNESQNWIRRNRRHEQAIDLDSIELPPIEPRQEDAVHLNETRRTLFIHLDKLNSRQRQALTMRYFEKASVPEIALALECSQGTARNILFRGLEKMRDGLRFSPLKSWSQL